MDFTQQFLKINVNGIDLSYTDSGTGATPLIFIHPFPFHQQVWQAQVAALSGVARVITYDNRGFGQSGTSKEEAAIDHYADDLIGLIKALGITKAIVCGLSMGGYIALNAMQRHPGYFKALVLCDTQCLADSPENKEKRYKTIREIEASGLEPFAKAFVKTAFTSATQQTNTALVEQAEGMILENPPQGIIAALTAMAGRRETCSALKRISVPTLVLCGKEDALTPVSLSEYLFNTIPGAMLKEIEKAGHLSNLEQAEIFNNTLRDFVREWN